MTEARHAKALRYASDGYKAIEISRAIDGLVLGELMAAGYIERLSGPRVNVKLTEAGHQASREDQP